MKLKALIKIFIITLLAAACSGNPTRNQLADIESYIQDRPDSALVNLEAIKANITSENSRASKADKAKFSLLYAMALDKNYIDTTDISIIEPAVEYYNSALRKGLYKFMSNFYLGRIYENAGNFKEAIEAFLKAEEHKKSAPINYHTKLYAGLNRVYSQTMSTKKAIDATKKECESAKLSGDTYDYGVVLLDLAFQCLFNGDIQEYKKYLNEFETSITESNRDTWLQAYYLKTCLEYNLATNNITQGFADTLNLYCSSPEDCNFLFCLRGFLQIKDVEKATEMLNKLEQDSSGTYTPSAIYYYKSELEALKGDMDGAYHDLNEYVELQDASNIYALDNELVALEDKFKVKLMKQKQLVYGIITASIAIILAGFFILKYRQRRKENLILRHEFELTREEIANLVENNKRSDEEKKRLSEGITKRISTLISAFSSGKKNPEQAFISELSERIKDKHELIECIADFYSLRNETFYNKLKEANLSNSEIGYCCLYTLGFRSSEVGDIIDRKDFYQINSIIRAKLGLKPNDTNLSNYINKLYSQTLEDPS